MGAADLRSCRARYLEDDCVPATAAGADRGHAEAATAAAQLLDQAEDDAGAAGADGVAERDCATIHIDATGVDTEPLAGDDGNTGECLVDFPDFDVGRLESSPGKCLLGGYGRRVGEIGDFPGGLAVGQDASAGRQPLRRCPICACDYEGGRAIVDSWGVAGGDRAI